ncbi:tRNA lysidine(34) synthetase TilS [bacterium]|nr:tRNA lysidine(34) synthetase TilS [bacterium]
MSHEQQRRPLPEAVLAASPVWDGLDGGSLIVACSGGADSVGLLRAAHALLVDPVFSSRFNQAPRLLTWHYNHRVRPESDADEDFVSQLGAQLGLAGMEEGAPLRELHEQQGGNLEALMRRERYRALLAWIEELRREPQRFGPVCAMTAHHLGDQAETILHHLIRGTHLSGIRGIHPLRNDCIHRPWLLLPPEEIREYLRGLGQEWREDAGNADISLTRNRLRHSVIPELLQINPRAREHIARLAGTAELAASAVAEALQELEVEIFTSHDLQRWLPLLGWQTAEYQLHRCESPAFGSADLLARYAWTQLRSLLGSLDNADWKQIDEWALQPQRRLSLKGWQLRLLHPSLLAFQGPEQNQAQPQQAELQPGSRLRLGGLEISLQPCSSEFWSAERSRQRHPWERIRDWGQALSSITSSPPLGPAWHCCLPRETAFPLRIRTAGQGDRLPLVNSGSKLLSDIFIDAKLPRCFRPVWPVLCDSAGNALWLPGLADGAGMRIADGQSPAWLLSLRDISAHDRA